MSRASASSVAPSTTLSDYSQHILVDAPLTALQVGCTEEDVKRHLLAALRHHTKLPLDIPSSPVACKAAKSIYDDDDDDGEVNASVNQLCIDDGVVNSKLTTYRCLLSICNSYDIIAQQYIVSALFERNLLAPYEMYNCSTKTFSSSLQQAIWYSKYNNANPLEDTKLPRLLVVGQKGSTTMKTFLKEFFKADSLADEDVQFPVVDIGVATLYVFDSNDVTQSSSVPQGKVILFYCNGIDTVKLDELLKLDIDLVVYELKNVIKNDERRVDPQEKNTIVSKLKELGERKPQLLLVHDKYNPFGSQDGIFYSSMGKENLLKIRMEFLAPLIPEEPFQSVNKKHIYNQSNVVPRVRKLISEMENAGDVLKVRDSLLCQKTQKEIFALEREASLTVREDERFSLTEVIKTKKLDAKSRLQKPNFRQNRFLTLFIGILNEPNATMRSLLFLAFQRQLEVLNSNRFHEANPRYKVLLKKKSKTNQEDTILSGLHEKEALCILGVEHLWRELAALYSLVGPSFNDEYSRYPYLAAVHLLDGFTMEFIDGEACQINQEWLEAILQQVGLLMESVLSVPSPKIACLSVIGQESSGKTTLLNTMFGCRLRTSLLRCTKGINLQLVKCKDRSNCDYILLLDVEGVRSSKFDKKFLHDNRLCTMAMFLAHACIVIMNGNQMVSICKILSMVKKADIKINTSKGCSYWKDPYFAERGLNKVDGIEQLQHIGEFKRLLEEQKVYDAGNIKCDFTMLASNDVNAENAALYGIQVKQMRERMRFAKTENLSAFTMHCKDIRSSLLSIEKEFDHECNLDQLIFEENEGYFHEWNSEVQGISHRAIQLLDHHIAEIKECIYKGIDNTGIADAALFATFPNVREDSKCKAAIKETIRSRPQKNDVEVLQIFFNHMTQATINDSVKKFKDKKSIFGDEIRRRDYERRMTIELENLRLSNIQCIRQLVAAKLELCVMFEEARQNLIKRAKELFRNERNISPSRVDEEFNTAFANEINKLQQRYSTIDVAAYIDEYFDQKRVRLPEPVEEYRSTSYAGYIYNNLAAIIAPQFARIMDASEQQKRVKVFELLRRRCVYNVEALRRSRRIALNVNEDINLIVHKTKRLIHEFDQVNAIKLSTVEENTIWTEVKEALFNFFHTNNHRQTKPQLFSLIDSSKSSNPIVLDDNDGFLYEIADFVQASSQQAIASRILALENLRTRCCDCVPPRSSATAIRYSGEQTNTLFNKVQLLLADFNRVNPTLSPNEENLILVEFKKYLFCYQFQCHSLWDEKNSPIKLLQSEENNLKNIFRGIVLGEKAANMLGNVLQQKFNDAMKHVANQWVVKNAFESIIQKSFGENIYLNSKIFQAFADLDLLCMSDNEIIPCLKQTKGHYNSCLKKCLQNSIEKIQIPNFREKIFVALKDASTALQQHVEEDRVIIRRIEAMTEREMAIGLLISKLKKLDGFSRKLIVAIDEKINTAEKTTGGNQPLPPSNTLLHLQNVKQELERNSDVNSYLERQLSPFNNESQTISVAAIKSRLSGVNADTVVFIIEVLLADHSALSTSGCIKAFFNKLSTVLIGYGIEINFGEMEALGGVELDKCLQSVALEDIPLVEVSQAIERRNQINAASPMNLNKCIETLKNELMNNITSNSRFRLRCSACCPMCGIQCDHPDGRGHAGRHRSYHQPQGFIGTYELNTNYIVCDSCVSSASDGRTVRLADGQIFPYREFGRAFPEWDNLEWQNRDRCIPLKVRELLFKKHANTIAEEYGKNENPQLPRYPYGHVLSDVQSELQEVANLNQA